MAVFNADVMRRMDELDKERESLLNVIGRNGGMGGGGQEEGGDRIRGIALEEEMMDGSEGQERTPDRIVQGEAGLQGPSVLEKTKQHKRTVTDRSPVTEEIRQTRRRLNEFDMGEVFAKIGQTMRNRTEEAVAGAPEEIRDHLSSSMGVIMKAVEDLMDTMSDGIKQERVDRETADKRKEDRIAGLEEKLQEVAAITGSLTNNNVKGRIKESVREMEKKVEEASCSVKVLDIDIGKETEDRREIVRKALDTVRGNAREDNQRWLDSVLRRTRVVVLGKRTTRRTVRDNRTEFSVPILFQCRDRRDTEDLDNILRGAGYYPSFHWPREMMEFVGGVREEVKRQGYSDREYFYKVRPEVRDGVLQVKVEVKPKEGNGRFSLKGVWGCPPLQRQLWETVPGLFKSKLVGRI
jgi:hypothetical protein